MNTPGIQASKSVGIRGREYPIRRPKRHHRGWYMLTVITVKRTPQAVDSRQAAA
jgi:hypothetical protein